LRFAKMIRSPLPQGEGGPQSKMIQSPLPQGEGGPQGGG
jgi:hypothetical protein